MIRLIKRYGSRKLYDTEESRYVGLDEIAAWIRTGQEVRVVDQQDLGGCHLRHAGADHLRGRAPRR